MIFSILNKMEQGHEALDDQDLVYLLPYADTALAKMGGELRFMVRLGDKAPKAWKASLSTLMTYQTFFKSGSGKLGRPLMDLLEDVLLSDSFGEEESGLTEMMGQFMCRALLEDDTVNFRRLTAMTERLAAKNPHITLSKVFAWNNEAVRKIALTKNNVAAMRHIISCVPPLGCTDRKGAIKEWLLENYRGSYMVVDSYHLGHEEMQEMIIRRARDVGVEADVLKFSGAHTIAHAIQSGNPRQVKKCWERLKRHSTQEEMKQAALLEQGALLWSGLKNEVGVEGAAFFLAIVNREHGSETLKTLLDEQWVFSNAIHEGAVPLLTEFYRRILGADALQAFFQKDKYEVFLNAAHSRKQCFYKDLLSIADDMKVIVDGKEKRMTEHMFADNDAHLLKEIIVAASLENLTYTFMYLMASGQKDAMEKAITSGTIAKAGQRSDLLERLSILMSVAEEIKVGGVAVPECAADIMHDKKMPVHEVWQRLGGEGGRWTKITNREPPAGVDKVLSPYNFKPQLYAQILPYIEKLMALEKTKPERAPYMAYQLSVLFSNKDEVERFLDKTIERHKPHNHGKPIAKVMDFDVPLRGMWTVPHWRGLAQRYGFAATKFIGCAAEIEALCKKKDLPLPRTPQDIRDLARIVLYDPDEKHLDFAGLAVDFNLAAGLYEQGVKLLEEELKTEGLLPDVVIDGAAIGKDNYYMEKLPDHDPRGLVLGEITNCCQTLGNNGEYAARAGMTDAESGFYVWKHKTKGKITPQDTIVAQSWAWLSPDRKALVFDSFERLSSAYNHLASPFIEQFAHEVQAAGQIEAVYVGAEGETPKENSWRPKMARPFGLYREGIAEKTDSNEVYPVDARDHRAQAQPGGGAKPRVAAASGPA